ncbi:hypothetical protein [Nocardia asteroides]|uniref:hypothetical protein n=1 Tax=Nocardia asteroides TaxID=1824 RepID=UPI001E46D1CE|nr:hypothetical protein [Nocardia asteroides]UGT61796.1 hypothetical protein LTT61_00095 [Nocardia asteroides]
MARVLDGVQIDTAVEAALRAAAVRRSPVDTGALLAELPGIVPSAVIAREPDPGGAGGLRWRDIPLTDSCATALVTAARLAERQARTPVPAELVVLGLITDPASGASRALGADRAAVLGAAPEKSGTGRATPQPTAPAPPPRSRRTGPSVLSWRGTSDNRKVAVILAVIVVVALPFVGYYAYREYFGWPDYRLITDEDDFTDGCGDPRKYFPHAAAFAGPAPHPIIAFRNDGIDATGPGYPRQVQTSRWPASRPAQWMAAGPADYQLIACLGRAEAGDYLQDCVFSSGRLPLHRGRYHVTVYEAKTGKEVGKETMNGAVISDDPDPCPVFVWYRGAPPALFTEPTLDEFRSVLGEYVDGAGR